MKQPVRQSSTRRIGLLLALVGAAAAGATQPDTIIMHHGAKAALPVLANDTGTLVAASVTVTTPPAWGIATARTNGTILYEHTSSAPATDQFTYRVTDSSDVTSAPETVSIFFSTDARLAATTLALPPDPPSTTYQAVNAFPGLTFSAPTSMESPAGDTNRLFVAERAGRIYVVTNQTAASPAKILFLDISGLVTNDNNELGMKGLAFHPGYATNGIFFVTYNSTQGTARLSRFLRDPVQPDAVDTNSEVVLINQLNDGLIHNINDAQFGPDGYLYVGFGDEGYTGDSPTNTQVITKDFWSSIIRIDPDKRPGNLEPNPHPAVPTNGGGLAYYSIPTNNPFLGATQFNGAAVNPTQVRTEFFAVGFRNPWQFSFDTLNGDLWVGDVGNSAWEEINVMPAGGNGGWAYFEGTHPGPRTPPPGFTYVPPVWEYPHDSGPFAGSAVTGGFVVRNNVYPDLAGKYICADIISGNIWSIERIAGTTSVERIAGEGTIVQFAVDSANGTILMADYDEGLIKRLVQGAPSAPFPETLTDTGLFADLADLAPNPGVVFYDLNLPFWSDYAIKRRWFALTNLSDLVGFQRDEPWTTPTGMVWVKHFDLDLDRGNAATRKRIETRVLVLGTNGSYGVSYRWNDAGTEAMLVADAGDSFALAITNSGVPGTQTWRIPSRTECRFCHTPAAGHALGFNTRQLNRSGQLAAAVGNFIDLLANGGYLGGFTGVTANLPRHLRPDETSYSLEARARSYLAVNCGYCHQGAASTVPGQWDGRAHPRLADCGLVLVPASDNGGDTNNLLLVPGQTSHSIIWNRLAATNGFTRMPPIASSELDPAGIQLVADWIAQELPGWQAYADWRLAVFGNTNAPQGEPDVDPDLDLRSNYEEFLARTSPTNEESAWSGSLGRTSNGVEISYSLFNRSVLVEASTNLVQWNTWPVSGNDGLPAASGVVVRITSPDTNAQTFYRFRIEER